MRIGIDIDGVLTDDDQYLLDCTSKYCYENNRKGFVNPYGYEFDKLDWDEETIEDYRAAYFYDYLDLEPARKFAGEVIKKLRGDGHDIFIITGRYKTYENTVDGDGQEIRDKTIRWLKKNDIIYDQIIFAKVPKIRELKENKIDLMVEDSPDTIRLIKEFTHVFCFDTRYNRNVGFDSDQVTRVFSWYDLYMKLNARIRPF